MTESEWLTAMDPTPLLAFLLTRVRPRKLWLFVTACCRHLWASAEEEATQAALGLVEQLAEDGGMRIVRAADRHRPGQPVLECGASEPVPASLAITGGGGLLKWVDRSALPPALMVTLEYVGCLRQFDPRWLRDHFAFAGLGLETQTQLLRDIVRGPLGPLYFRSAWRTRNEGIVPRMAQRIYDERAFDLLPILADALEECGCAEADILNHCRQPGEHVRGCWVVDLILGKE